MLLATLVGVVGAAHQSHRELNDHEAIILTPSVAIKSAPDEKSTDLFVLHEGVKVEVLDSMGDWVKIQLPDGKVGWTERSNFAVI